MCPQVVEHRESVLRVVCSLAVGISDLTHRLVLSQSIDEGVHLQRAVAEEKVVVSAWRVGGEKNMYVGYICD